MVNVYIYRWMYTISAVVDPCSLNCKCIQVCTCMCMGSTFWSFASLYIINYNKWITNRARTHRYTDTQTDWQTTVTETLMMGEMYTNSTYMHYMVHYRCRCVWEVSMCYAYGLIYIHFTFYGPRYKCTGACAWCFQPTYMSRFMVHGNVQVCTVFPSSGNPTYMSRFMVHGKCTGVHGVSKLWKCNLHVTFYGPQEVCIVFPSLEIQPTCHVLYVLWSTGNVQVHVVFPERTNST